MNKCRVILFAFLVGIVSAGMAFAGNTDEYRAERERMIKRNRRGRKGNKQENR